MKRRLWRCAIGLLLAALSVAAVQRGMNDPDNPWTQPPAAGAAAPNPRPPRGTAIDEMLKAEHKQSLKDAAQLVELAKQLQADLEKNDRFVVSLSTVKKTDDIE